MLWLDAFENIAVSSVFETDGRTFRRAFEFVLAPQDQVQNELIEELPPQSAPTGTTVRFRGLRGTAYSSRFPAQSAAIVRQFGSHFLAEFIMGRSPQVNLSIGDHTTEFPQGIQDLLLEDRGISELETANFGNLQIAHFIFRAAASAGFDGNHQLHLIANGRTVSSRKIDGLLGVGRLGEELSGDFAAMIRSAADDVRAEEQRQLTEYVLRRRVVLDVLDVLVRRLREHPSGQDTHYLESTLHQFICPMRMRGDDPNRIESSGHDLWVIDERLAFANYFASDVPMSQIVANETSTERPDLFIWDRIHGLGMEGDEPLTRVMLIEFKKPGRTEYDERYSPQNQIARYLAALSNGEVESFRRERVRIAQDCVFYCYVVADIAGSLDTYTSYWKTTADGRGRWTELSGKYRGTIEIIEWRDLIKDARARNRAFIELAR